MDRNPLSILMVGSLMKNLMSDEIKLLESAIKNRLVYTLDLTNNRWDVRWADIKAWFHNLPDDPDFIYNKVAKLKQDPVGRGLNIGAFNGTFTDVCIYRGTPILIKMCFEKSDKRKESVELMTIHNKKHRRNLRRFVAMLMKKRLVLCEKHDIKYVNVVDPYKEELPGFPMKYRRSFENVFIPEEQHMRILKCINDFIKKRKWYEEHHIPYHFGVLLYGPAGTGKSSIIQAMICQWNCRALYIKSGDMGAAFSNTGWINSLSTDLEGEPPTLIISEDIDISDFTEKRTDTQTKRTTEVNQLGKVINFMDGINSPQNVVYIFTTNHIEKLDPALIRPGRIDLTLKVDYASNETFSKFLMFHYKRSLPYGKTVVPNLTFAAVQTDVMMDATFEDIIDKYTI